jgi:CheY-like chemotaxis protein/uncharacterized coiled-coil protein SlyX
MKKKILVIDDSVMIRKMVNNILRNKFEVIEAKNGAIGLEMARQQSPDLVLLDFVMPVMDGYDTMQAIRQDKIIHATPIVIMSGMKEELTARIPEPFEGFDFIEKPFEAEALIQCIEKALSLAAPPLGVSSDGARDLLLDKLTNIEVLLIQGMENLLQREVGSKMVQIQEQISNQESDIDRLKNTLDKVVVELKQQNRALNVMIKEFKRIREEILHQSSLNRLRKQ